MVLALLVNQLCILGRTFSNQGHKLHGFHVMCTFQGPVVLRQELAAA